MYNMPVES